MIVLGWGCGLGEGGKIEAHGKVRKFVYFKVSMLNVHDNPH